MSIGEAIRIMINADEEIQVLRRQLVQAISDKEIMAARFAESERENAALKRELEEFVGRFSQEQASVAACSAMSRADSSPILRASSKNRRCCSTERCSGAR